MNIVYILHNENPKLLIVLVELQNVTGIRHATEALSRILAHLLKPTPLPMLFEVLFCAACLIKNSWGYWGWHIKKYDWSSKTTSQRLRRNIRITMKDVPSQLHTVNVKHKKVQQLKDVLAWFCSCETWS